MGSELQEIKISRDSKAKKLFKDMLIDHNFVQRFNNSNEFYRFFDYCEKQFKFHVFITINQKRIHITTHIDIQIGSERNHKVIARNVCPFCYFESREIIDPRDLKKSSRHNKKAKLTRHIFSNHFS